jgi:hypothetical protein
MLVVISDFNQVDIATDHSRPYLGLNPPVAREIGIRVFSINFCRGVEEKNVFIFTDGQGP